MNAPPKQVRCAIYTRKSSEEGLEQSFNSLHAQREACEAYVLSQKHEGWKVIATPYDDGGFSGGNMERPGLKQLLSDIAAAKIDTVVVYKVDRLTRSLPDFARIVESFDGKGVSFVSVTQQFNTTSSMGRLTLNVLLSFAQFEREVTGERIRDKVAASKRKGMWMGGNIPLGYDLKDRGLVINEAEAETVRDIFTTYLRLKSVFLLQKALLDRGILSKRRVCRSGRDVGGKNFSRGTLYHLLSSPLYIGKVPHGDKVYDGLHEAIIDPETWAATAEMLRTNGVNRITSRNLASGRAQPVFVKLRSIPTPMFLDLERRYQDDPRPRRIGERVGSRLLSPRNPLGATLMESLSSAQSLAEDAYREFLFRRTTATDKLKQELILSTFQSEKLEAQANLWDRTPELLAELSRTEQLVTDSLTQIGIAGEEIAAAVVPFFEEVREIVPKLPHVFTPNKITDESITVLRSWSAIEPKLRQINMMASSADAV